MRGAVPRRVACATIAGLLDHRGSAHEEARSLDRIISRALVPFLIITLVAGIVSPAFASPLDDKRAQAAQIAAQVEQLDEQLEIAAEQYNEAHTAYREVTAKVKQTEAQVADLSAKQTALEQSLAVRATAMYRQGPLGALEVLLGSTTFEEFAATWQLLQQLNEDDAANVGELKQTRAELATVQQELAQQQAEAKAQSDAMQANKAGIETQLAERKNLLSGVEAEIAAIQRAQEEAARRRAEAAAAAARAKSRPTDYGNPTNAPRSEVVNIALSKLGAPYSWGAAGPNSFDCSGFTMWCYARVGVSLPHSSRAQISVGQRVSRENLKPGDLVFFGRSTIHHVGIYIGNGNFVHAPNTGDVVKISSLDARSDYVGACRP